MTSVFGDIVSKFDSQRRQGINFHIAGSSSAYNSMSDARYVHFGLDDGYLGEWQDCGKPCASNSLVTCLTEFEGELYCGIADAQDPNDAARVFRWAGGGEWVDCGRLGDDPNHLSVQSMTVHRGQLYAGTGIWDWDRARGKVAGKPAAAKPRVFVYEGGTKWRDMGQVGENSRVLCMASFRDELYVGVDRVDRATMPGRCYKYTGTEWVDCGSPDTDNFENLLPLGGTLYAATHGSLFQYDGGQAWTCIGDHPFDITQIHSLDVFQGKLHAGTWPQGYVLRYEGNKQWVNTGRLGLAAGTPECNEVNDLVVHNGKMYAGVIPKSELYRYERDTEWTLLKSLSSRPDWARDQFPTWCRLTAMASHQGKLFAGTGSCVGRSLDVDPDGTLGRVQSIEIGQVVSHERDIGGDWTHLAVVRHGADVSLYVNGKVSVSSQSPNGRIFDLSNMEPLLIGFGAQTHFTGAIADLRLYSRGLEPDEVLQIHAGKEVAEELPFIPPKSPAESLKAMRIHPACRVELAAAEPLLASPVAIDFDEDGRLYVAEFGDFNQQHSRQNHGRGRVRLLDDTDGDGVFDKSTVFLADLDLATSVCCWDGGVFVGAVPNILYAKDTDGDGRADVRRVVFTGFGRDVGGEALLNSFHWKFDNRIHLSTSNSGGEIVHAARTDARPVSVRGQGFLFDPRTEAFEVTSGGGQHGMSFDDWGHKFVCTSHDPAFLVMYDGRYLARNPYLVAPAAASRISPGGYATKVFRISQNEPWRVVRTRWRTTGVEEPHPTEGDQPSGYFSAASGVTIYRGDLLPADFQGNLFIGEVSNNLVYRARLEPDGIGLTALRADRDVEFLASSDLWFRPVQFANGPDGALYVIDMYRHLIEAAEFMSPDLVKHMDVGAGFDMGRIYRIVPKDFTRPKPPRLSRATSVELAALLEHSNGWHRDTASRLLYQRQDLSAVKPLKKLAIGSNSPLGRMHALYALHGLKSLDVATVLKSLHEADPRVREQAVRLAERFESSPEVRDRLEAMTGDPDRRVRYQLAYSLGEVRGEMPGRALVNLVRRESENSWFRLAVLSSINGRAGEVIDSLLADKNYRATSDGQTFLVRLAELVGSANNADDIAALTQGMESLPENENGLALKLAFALVTKLPSDGRDRISRLDGGKVGELFDHLFRRAVETAPDDTQPVKERVAAIRLLGLSEFTAQQELFGKLLTFRQPQPVQAAAVETLARFNHAGVPEMLLETWPSLSPQIRASAVETLFSRPAWIGAFLDAVEKGQVRRGDVDPARIQTLMANADGQIRTRTAELFVTAKLASRQDVVAAYQESLRLEGNATQGKGVFKKHCSACHQLEGVGAQIGADLNAARNRGLESVLLNILDPNREVKPQFHSYVLVTDSGTTLTGMIADETANSLTIRRADGTQETILRIHIEELRSTGLSFMPEGLEKLIDVPSMGDLLAYLNSIK
ncbi:MAG: PVC-type heme-binding CxxCH protein, partial [Planctomycetales bacterium]